VYCSLSDGRFTSVRYSCLRFCVTNTRIETKALQLDVCSPADLLRIAETVILRRWHSAPPHVVVVWVISSSPSRTVIVLQPPGKSRQVQTVGGARVLFCLEAGNMLFGTPFSGGFQRRVVV
jgi:hypothetical protein